MAFSSTTLAQGLVFIEYRHSLEEIDQRITRFEHELSELAQRSPHAATIGALQAMRGIKLLTATTIVSEVGDLGRFENPRAVDGLRRLGAVRAQQRQSSASRLYHQER